MASNKNELILDGVNITHPDRIFVPTQNITKGALARYYHSISELILPHLINRPVVLVRCTDHQTSACFYQKHYTHGFPDSILKIDIQEDNHAQKSPYIMIKNKKGLLSLIQFSTLELHTWGSSTNNIEKPDRIIFDLDPGPNVPWKKVIYTAKMIRDRLLESDLTSFVKTTGGKGLHIVVPIIRSHTWDYVKDFSKHFSQRCVEENPSLYTLNPLKRKREAKIFIDYLRNGRGSLAVAPYSTRAKAGAPISTPLLWEELNHLKSGDHYTLANIEKRLRSLTKPPWEEFFKVRQRL